MKVLQFQVTGRVVESTARKPIANLKVEAWDKDVKFNDLLGQTYTNADGAFEISFDSTYFREHAPDAKPDLLFRVFLGKRLLKLVDDKVLTNAGEQTDVTLRVFMPEMMEEKEEKFGMVKALEISEFLQKSDFKGLMGQVKETAGTQFKFVTDMFKNSLSNFDFSPIKVGDTSRESVVGQDVEAASSYLQAQEVTVNEVKKYEPKLNRKSLTELTGAPLNLKPGQKIDLYEENGKVKYYAITREQKKTRDSNIGENPDVGVLMEELKASRKMASEKDEKINKLELEMELMRKDHAEIRTLMQSDAVARLLKQAKTTETVKAVRKKTPGTGKTG